jgi:hypothetical protein
MLACPARGEVTYMFLDNKLLLLSLSYQLIGEISKVLSFLCHVVTSIPPENQIKC